MPILKKRTLTPAEQFRKTREALGYKRDPRTGKLLAPGQLKTSNQLFQLELEKLDKLNKINAPKNYVTKSGKVKNDVNLLEERISFKKRKIEEKHEIKRTKAETTQRRRRFQFNKTYINKLLSKRRTNLSKMYTLFEKEMINTLVSELRAVADKHNIDLEKHHITVDYQLAEVETPAGGWPRTGYSWYQSKFKWKEYAIKNFTTNLRKEYTKKMENALTSLPITKIKTPEDAHTFVNNVFIELKKKKYAHIEGLPLDQPKGIVLSNIYYKHL